jgi:hypothetical protein
LLLISLSSAKDRQKHAEELLKHAQEATDIRSATSRPFRLQARFHFAGKIYKEPVDVEYKEMWRSPDQWRREMSSPDFEQVEVGGKEKRWVLHDLALEPARMRYIREWTQISLFAVGKVSLFTDPASGGAGHCVSQSHPIQQTLCFGPATGLLTRRKVGTEPGSMSCDYGDYEKVGDRTYPRALLCSADMGFTISGAFSILSENDTE